MRDQLLALAAASPDREVCGLLFGDDREISAITPAINVAARPADSFEIDPATLIAAHKAMRAGGPTLIGCYHSHPNGVAVPSARDEEAMAALGWIWLIIAGHDMVLWRLIGAVAHEVPLRVSTIPRN